MSQVEVRIGIYLFSSRIFFLKRRVFFIVALRSRFNRCNTYLLEAIARDVNSLQMFFLH